MFITNNATSKANKNTLKNRLVLFTISLLPFFPFVSALANELNTEQYTVSQGALKKDLNEQRRKNIIETNKLTALPDQLNSKATTKTREVILSQSNTVRKANKGYIAQSNNQNYYADFTIYGATSFLQDDYDGDGFYQTFSVTFDADIYSYTDNQFGEVYALLYISKNGGPWTHYFTTDDFLIEGDTDLDEYEVMTTFLSGYSEDYYDVLIDLYQVGYSDIVATYSSDDSNALYSLTLESADYDEPYVEPYIEIIEISGGGSMAMLILLLLCIYFVRIKSRAY